MTGTNFRGALYSFLRVLAVALSTAILPYLSEEELNTKAIVIACVAAFLLTVINFFRPGEPRFGPEPKVDENGYSLVELMVVVFLAVLAAAVLLAIF